MDLKQKVRKVTSLALVLAGLATPTIAVAQSEVDASTIENFYRIDRLTRNNDFETAKTYVSNVKSSKEVNFVHLLENGHIFVLNTENSIIDGKKVYNITGVSENFSPTEQFKLLSLTPLDENQAQIIYGKASSFPSNNLPRGYKKCLNLDYVQEIDENKVGNYDYVHISPRYNPNSLETKEFYTKEEYEQILESLKYLTSSIKENDNDFVKMAKIYLAVMDYMTYDFDEFYKGYDRDSSSGNLLALLKGKGVCTAYTDIMYNAAMYCGVKCEPAVGQTDTSGHSWNVFYYTDKFGNTNIYGVDATYGDGNSKEVRANFATNIFEQTHFNYFNSELPLAYCDTGVKSNSGFGNLLIQEFLELVKNDINIRPETYAEMRKNGITFEMIIAQKNSTPSFFEAPVEEFEKELLSLLKNNDSIHIVQNSKYNDLQR